MRQLLVVVALAGCAKAKSHDNATGGDETAAAGSPATLPPYTLKPVDSSEAQDIATLKDRVGSAVSKWLSEDTTADGWILTYESPHRENVQDDKTLQVELKVVGVEYGVYVRRTIGGQPFKCVAQGIERRADIARVVAACKTAKP